MGQLVFSLVKGRLPRRNCLRQLLLAMTSWWVTLRRVIASPELHARGEAISIKMKKMKKLTFTITSDSAGMRVDKFIANALGEEYSRTYVKLLMDNEKVSVNGKQVKPSYALTEDDVIDVELVEIEGEDKGIEPENIPLNILYEDETIIVLNKPVGLVVHPGAGNKTGTLVNALLHHCGSLPEASDRLRPGIVHRLDKDTTGVMVVAKTSKALRSLAKQFQNRTVTKHYLALVKGKVELDNDIIEAAVARDPFDHRKMTVNVEDGKNATTIYHVLRRFKNFTLLRLEIKTGRTHQIRVHMRHIGHSVIGDMVYDGDRRMPRQALHAERLKFTHPAKAKT